MAAKNTAPYIRQCLDSVVAQTYENWELIVINDHSTDETANIVKEYEKKDSRIKLVHSKRNKLIPALKEGYEHVTGELINRMDSDDKMPHDKLESLVAEWLKYGKGYIVAGGTEHFVEEGTVGGGFRRYEKWLNNIARNQLHYQEIYKECVIPSHCWIIHKDNFDEVEAFNPEVYPEDYDLCFRFYRANMKVIGIDKILHYWRDRSNRISRTWEEYEDNRYFDLKLKYFYELDRDRNRPLVVWGAGRNGKDLVKKVQHYEEHLKWVCDNDQKIGKHIYNIEMQSPEAIGGIDRPQILLAIANQKEVQKVREQLKKWDKKPVEDFWQFL